MIIHRLPLFEIKTIGLVSIFLQSAHTLGIHRLRSPALVDFFLFSNYCLRDGTTVESYIAHYFFAMISLLELPNELLLLTSKKLKSNDLSRLLQVNHRLYDLLLPSLYQRDVKSSNSQGLIKCAANGNERGVQHFLYWGGAYVDVKAVSNFHRGRGYYHLSPERLNSISFMILSRPMSEGKTPLGMAASAGHDAVVSLLLDHGARLNDFEGEKPLTRSYTPAIQALLGGHESTLKLLLERGAETEGPNMLFGGLINCAVASGQMSMLKLLIEFGVDINVEINGVYPLFWAVRRTPNYVSMVEVLLDNGASIALVDDDQGRLLHQAIDNGTIETLHLLLKRGATFHQSVFYPAIRQCTLQTVRLLLEYGAEVNFESLLCAVKSKFCGRLELFIDRGFDLNLRDSRGCTILHHAIRCCGTPTPIFRPPMMCGFGPSPPVVQCPPGSSSQRVAAYCRRKGYGNGTAEDIVRCLVRRGADVNAMDRKRQTPLYFAWKYASPDVQQLLLENGADWTAMLTIY